MNFVGVQENWEMVTLEVVMIDIPLKVDGKGGRGYGKVQVSKAALISFKGRFTVVFEV